MALENILQRIREDSGKEKEKIEAKARQDRDKVLRAAEKEIQGLRGRRAEETAREAEDEKKRRLSAARLELKKQLLILKHEILNGVFEEAFGRIRNFSDEEYTRLFETLLLAHAPAGEGRIHIGAGDRKRISPEFIRRMNGALKDSGTPCNYELDSADAGIEGGFILETGNMTVDCSFEALFAAAKQDLQKEAGKILFKNG